jgi:glycosyltransferase involved in cell wall biosynthesis
LPIVSELVSLFAPIGLLCAVSAKGACNVVFYNRMHAYLPTLLASKLLGNRNFLDLEDGEVVSGAGGFKRILAQAVKRTFDRFCRYGALLACRALGDYTRIRPVQCYYGTASNADYALRFQAQSVSVLMGGTLSPDTGANLLIDAIGRMRSAEATWTSKLNLHVTGSGPSLPAFQALAKVPGHPVLTVHGRTTNAEYSAILRSCDVGLALKLNTGALADTTFPSKVIEYAAAGMLVLTTDISDVRQVLGDGALYLQQDNALQLVSLFERVVQDRIGSQSMAALGCERVRAQCSPASAGRLVSDFLAGAR